MPPLHQVLFSGPTAFDTAPAGLRFDARYLARPLRRDEGASLQTLKDEVRRERALELLLRTARPIKQAAKAAGFQNEKSFIRAFHHWTGQSPAQFRLGKRPLA